MRISSATLDFLSGLNVTITATFADRSSTTASTVVP